MKCFRNIIIYIFSFRSLFSTSAGLKLEVLREISEKAAQMLAHERFLSLPIDEIKSIITFYIGVVHFLICTYSNTLF